MHEERGRNVSEIQGKVSGQSQEVILSLSRRDAQTLSPVFSREKKETALMKRAVSFAWGKADPEI
ncbi:hypothetical protein DUD43_09730 [Alcaligenes faecalis]|nr:hypothetical protein DUD43_09730 [Alcaligenes faecalis]